MAHASRPRQSRRTGRTRGRRDGSAAARNIVRSYAGIPSRPGYRARRVRAPRPPRPGSSARCARVAGSAPARSQDQDQACRRHGPRANRAARSSCTRRRARSSGRTARGRRARGRSGHAAPLVQTARSSEAHAAALLLYGNASPADRRPRAGHDSLPRIHVRVTKRARRATEIELSAALTLTVQHNNIPDKLSHPHTPDNRHIHGAAYAPAHNRPDMYSPATAVAAALLGVGHAPCPHHRVCSTSMLVPGPLESVGSGQRAARAAALTRRRPCQARSRPWPSSWPNRRGSW